MLITINVLMNEMVVKELMMEINDENGMNMI